MLRILKCFGVFVVILARETKVLESKGVLLHDCSHFVPALLVLRSTATYLNTSPKPAGPSPEQSCSRARALRRRGTVTGDRAVQEVLQAESVSGRGAEERLYHAVPGCWGVRTQRLVAFYSPGWSWWLVINSQRLRLWNHRITE